MTNFTQLKPKTYFAIAFFSLLGFTSKAQNIEINSTWDAYGSTQVQLMAAGFNEFQLHFLANGVFKISYDPGSNPTEEQGTWTQLNANQFEFGFDSGSTFAQLCSETIIADYTIVSDIMTISNTTGNCTTVQSFFNQSTWEKVQAVSVNEQNTDDFTLYPNPASKTVAITWYNGAAEQAIELISPVGNKINIIILEQVNGTMKIDVSQLPAGTYMLKSANASKLFVVE